MQNLQKYSCFDDRKLSLIGNDDKKLSLIDNDDKKCQQQATMTKN